MLLCFNSSGSASSSSSSEWGPSQTTSTRRQSGRASPLRVRRGRCRPSLPGSQWETRHRSPTTLRPSAAHSPNYPFQKTKSVPCNSPHQRARHSLRLHFVIPCAHLESSYYVLGLLSFCEILDEQVRWSTLNGHHRLWLKWIKLTKESHRTWKKLWGFVPQHALEILWAFPARYVVNITCGTFSFLLDVLLTIAAASAGTWLKWIVLHVWIHVNIMKRLL